MNKQIIVFCGLPLTGKSTLARKLGSILKIPFIDIDEIRQELFQNPQGEMNEEDDHFQMRISYSVLFLITNYLSALNRAFIIAATFSQERYHQKIIAIAEKNNIPPKVIYLYASDGAIKKRILERRVKKDSFSGCWTWEHYERDKKRYIILSLPKLALDTSKPIEECLDKIVHFLGSK